MVKLRIEETNMFGFFKKNKKKEAKINPSEKRKKQRRKTENDRRDDVRWEPEKDDRRNVDDRRKNTNKWDGHDK